MSNGNSSGLVISWSLAGAFLLIGIIALGMWGCPQYEVYSQEQSGRAQLAKANQNREILVSQARAEKEAALLRSDAIKIMGQAAKDFPEYRQQEFIGAFAEAMKEGRISQIIYVPTEGNIPITEAGRWARPQGK
jgi:hypothetical protein